MTASVLLLSPYSQMPLDAGILTPALAWTLEYELEHRSTLAWLPGMEYVNQMVSLWHWTPLDGPQ